MTRSGQWMGKWLLSAAVLLALVTACAPAASPAAKPPAAAPASTAAPAAAKPAVSESPQPAKPAASASPEPAKPAVAQKGFYDGKTVRIIVGLAPGGGYDTYARALARHLGRHLPGNPNVIVENMEGASGLIAANHVYKVAPQDGTVIHSFVGGLSLQELLGQPGVEFESARFQWLGAPTPDTFACVVRKGAEVKSFAEWKAGGRQLLMGGIAPGGSVDDVEKIVRTAYGLPMKIVSGYGGTSKIRLAIDSGEVDGACYSWESWKATSGDAFKAGDLLVLGIAADKRVEDLPDVPTFTEMATTDEARQLITNGVLARSRTERAYLMGPGVPKEQITQVRQAFAATLKDPAFLEDAKKAKLDVNYVPAEEVEKRVRELFAMPAPLKETLRGVLTAKE